ELPGAAGGKYRELGFEQLRRPGAGARGIERRVLDEPYELGGAILRDRLRAGSHHGERRRIGHERPAAAPFWRRPRPAAGLEIDRQIVAKASQVKAFHGPAAIILAFVLLRSRCCFWLRASRRRLPPLEKGRDGVGDRDPSWLACARSEVRGTTPAEHRSDFARPPCRDLTDLLHALRAAPKKARHPAH